MTFSSRSGFLTGRVVLAGDVVQERPDASGRVVVCGVGKKRSGTDSRVEVAGEVALD
jgi:hypothetical protein